MLGVYGPRPRWTSPMLLRHVWTMFGPPNMLLRRLVQDSERRKIGLLIGCDANAHHRQWRNPDTNERDESIFDFILRSKLLDPVTKRRVLDKHSFSDHRYVEIAVNFENFTKIAVRNPRKVNWDLNKNILHRSLGQPPSRIVETYERFNAMVETLTLACNKAYHKACPVKRMGSIRLKKSFWWTSALTPFKKNGTNTDEAWETYKAELRRHNKELRKAKGAAWDNFCTNIQGHQRLLV
ncbi:uncharacterized protein LOC123257211 [Drosophila ananassae]|uniref:uncharacterized protein LOC123257211 n=1 Tax=Drosophila ananassae TaxID=7217 RepID=UPI001CFF83C0|nr:uncharacterized protein LOC123257211 [Drosophila ananassae]